MGESITIDYYNLLEKSNINCVCGFKFCKKLKTGN